MDLPRKSIIVACDVEMSRFEEIVDSTADLPAIGGYKIGAALALREGLPRISHHVRQRTSKLLIYDHQKAATDIPDTATSFMKSIAGSGIDAVILFPLSGPETEISWIRSAKEAGLRTIVGAHMTHRRFLASEGGWIRDSAIEEILTIASAEGVTDFVVPGNKPLVVEQIRTMLNSQGVSPTLFSPGFIEQGGDISVAARAAGSNWHAIVGRAIYAAPDVTIAVSKLSAGMDMKSQS